MGIKFLQKKIQMNRNGRKLNTVVIANRASAALHLPASAYLVNKSLEGLKIKSVEKYASIILSLIEEVDFDPELSGMDDLTDLGMSSYLEKVLYEERGIKGNTLNQHKQVLANFFTVVHELGHFSKPNRFSYRVSDAAEIAQAKSIGRQNSLDPYRLSEKYIPKNQFDLLLSFESSKNSFVRDRNEIMLRLGYEVGLRAAEVTSFENLSLDSIKQALIKSHNDKLNEIEVYILGKGRNGGNNRTVVIPPALRRKIERFMDTYKGQIKNHLICTDKGIELGESYATTIFRRAKENLIKKLDSDKSKIQNYKSNAERWLANTGWTFHALRHSFATNLSMCVISGEQKLPRLYVQERLGHAHRRTTLIYCHFAAVLSENLRAQNELSEELEKSSCNPIDLEFVDG